MQKRCGHCKVQKDVSLFDFSSSLYDGLSSTCKSCRAEHRGSVETKNLQTNRLKWADDMMRHIKPRGFDY